MSPEITRTVAIIIIDEIDITKTQVDESMDEEDKGKNEQNIVQCSEESLNDDRIKPCSKVDNQSFMYIKSYSTKRIKNFNPEVDD